MNIQKISASAYKRWNFCQQAYFIENVLKWTFPGGKAATLGTIVHAVLEILAQIKLAQQENKSEAITEIGNINTNNINIDKIIDNTYELYTNNPGLINLGWTIKEYKDVKKYVYKAISHNNETFNPLKRTIISTEQYIKQPLNEQWAILSDGNYLNITGFIDLITKLDENTIEIIDWKTGNPNNDFLTGKEINYTTLHNDIQLRLYHFAAAEKWGYDKNYLLTLFFLQNGPITISLSNKDISDTKEIIKKRFIEIYNCKVPKLSRTWKCTKFCDYGKRTFEGTKISPIIQFLGGGVTPLGNISCMCDQVNLEVNRRGLNWVTENMKNEYN